jgi:TetR/AcrR family transcriptional repressor of mexJK operon
LITGGMEMRADVGGKAEAVLAAARQLFMERGYGATNMDDIARGAKVGKATVYEYFQSKEDLFAAVVIRECTAHARMLQALDDLSGDLRTRLIRFAQAFLDFIIRPEIINVYRTIIAESVRAPHLGTSFYESGPIRVRSALAHVLAEASARGEIEAADPERAAVDLISLVRADLHLRALFAVPTLPAPTEKRQLAQQAVDRFLKAYAPAVA